MKFDPIISVENLEEILKDDKVVVVDVRFQLTDVEWGRNSYQEGHIPGAFYAHLDDDLSSTIIPGTTGRHPWPSVIAIEELLSTYGVTADSHVVVYDQGHGGIAARLWAMCHFAGLKKVSLLDGGWKLWTGLNKPQSTEMPSILSSGFKAMEPLFKLAGVETLRDHPCLIDARAAKRYRGEEEPIDPVAGHIPGAKSFPFLNNLNEDLTWQSAGELAERFKTISEEEMIVYCGSGVTACHNMAAMKRAGLELPQLYPGSWSHYITDPKREIARS